MFDIGCEQHGQYVIVPQLRDTKGDDDEPTPPVMTQWKAGTITALHVKTPEEIEEEKMLEEAQKAKAQLGESGT